jgi:F-type H+-transporting ATPase subunit gamma
MANLRDIRRRIKSVKNTSQITRAMQLVAASKMKRAQDQALNGRPFAVTLNKVINRLKGRVDTSDPHPLLAEHGGEGKELVVVINTDKGLCGGLNTNLLKTVLAGAPADADYVLVGKKLGKTLARSGRNLLAEFSVSDPVGFAECKVISHFLSEKFLAGEYSCVRIAFTNFVNTISQVPTLETLLPVSIVELGAKKSYDGMGQDDKWEAAEEAVKAMTASGYIYEPSPTEVFSHALPMYVNYQFYQMILEAKASEHSARMVAMKSATDNANQIAKDLTLEYNKVRQATITNELLEITTAMKALE